MSDSLTLPRLCAFAGSPLLPGSKSMANRVLLLSALARGDTVLHNVPAGDDVDLMLAALREMGIVAESAKDNSLMIRGSGGNWPAGQYSLHLGNAGTAMRFLTAACCLGKGRYVLDGTARMRQRPIGPLVATLRQLGAAIKFSAKDGFPPLEITGRGPLRGGSADIAGEVSSQFVSAVLHAAPCFAGTTNLTVRGPLTSRPYVDLSLNLMRLFKADFTEQSSGTWTVQATGYASPGQMIIEPDAAAASYFLAGAAINGRIRIEGLGSASLQGEARFCQVLAEMGAKVRQGPQFIQVEAAPMQGIDRDMNDLTDSAMTLAVLALFARGRTTLRNIGNWRVKESDRISAVACELRKLGASVEQGEDSLAITPPARIAAARIATYDDHRMAMAFSLAACATADIIIDDPGCVAKTFPDYFQQLAACTQS